MWDVSTQGPLARKHLRHIGTWASRYGSRLAREHVRTQDTLAYENVFSTHGTQFSRLVEIWQAFTSINECHVPVLLVSAKLFQGSHFQGQCYRFNQVG